MILFGGKSPEHEVSLRSASGVISNIDLNKFNVFIAGIDKEGVWKYSGELSEFKGGPVTPEILKKILCSDKELILYPGRRRAKIAYADRPLTGPETDVIFPVMHGTNCEDGRLQGLLELLEIPFVGPDTAGSAAGIDKDVMKRLLQYEGIKTARHILFLREEYTSGKSLSFEKTEEHLSLPLFVKPARQGSSVGVHKVRNEAEFHEALKDAFRYDRKVLVEECIKGREIECAVLGNETQEASVPGEVIVRDGFYDFETKYLNADAAELVIPAMLSDEDTEHVRDIALRSCRALGCEVMTRVDVFLAEKGEVFVNEVNTLPGFTSISMYPAMWEATGLKYSDLITKLALLAMERQKRETQEFFL